MKERRRVVSRQVLAQILVVLLLVGVLLAVLITEVVRAANAVSHERVRRASYTYTDSFYGYLLRDEAALRTNNNGPVHYLVADGDAVQSGAPIAEVYLDDTGTDKRERAAALSARIDACNAALAATEEAWQNDYLASYADVMQALSAGTPAEALSPADTLSKALMRRDGANTETAEALIAERDALQAEWMALVQHVDAPQTVPAAASGIFYRETDGLEALLGLEAASDLTPEGLDALLSSSIKAQDVIGKLVSTEAFVLALPVTAVEAITYTQGNYYTVHFERNSVSATLQLTQISASADGQRALLLLRGEEMPEGLSPERRQCVRVERQTIEGLCVPAAALLDGKSVYIDNGGVAKQLAVTPLLVQDGCVILKDVAPLQPGMRVIISTRRVYDGKVLN